VTSPARDPGSFRDPSGAVIEIGDGLYRTVTAHGAAEYEASSQSGLLADLVRDGTLVAFEEVEPRPLHGMEVPRHLLRLERLPFISHPYEWSYSALRAAALFHLDVQLRALDRGFALADATAFNVQFDGTRPVFIDHLSFRRYRDGEYWLAHRQFCEQFLNPLLLQARCGVAFQPWYRATLRGVDGADLAALLPWWRKLSPLVLLHVALPAGFQRRPSSAARAAGPRRPLPLPAYRSLLEQLRRGIDALPAPADRGSPWVDYAANTSYRPEQAAAKRDFVRRYAERSRPAMVWDFGCNTGEYSRVALAGGAGRVVGFDSDPAAVDAAFRAAAGEPFLPLVMDLTNPSPSQGWREAERAGLRARGGADGVLALALLHHVVMRGNVPLADALDWLIDLAPTGVIEFVPKSDPMVATLLALREDVFPGYHREAFTAAIARRAAIVEEMALSPDGRVLVAYERRAA
jgi:ribosomal protein L11 methylase PrmA